ncbi:hypothetical protein [Demequina rhizosphaerae]|uniref:hypothetical protein n=1 Tax=Demequina rhizosphaerae TaxID=1638985 RepID=UPI0007826E1A|nr:hypothetical protein [Demequina rhizosphaerae]
MSEELHAALDEAADEERRSFEAEHRGDEVGLYLRAIAPRRRARLLLPAVAAAVGAGMLGIGFLAPGASEDEVPVGASAGPTASVSPDPDARPGERGWTVQGMAVDPGATAAPLTAAIGDVATASSACPALETFGRLEGGSGWSTGVHVGAFVQTDGAANDVHVRGFENVEVAERYLGELKRIAERCDEALAEWGTVATVSRFALDAVEGEAVFVSIGVRGTSETWRLWVHVRGSEAVAVVADPAAPDLGAAIIRAWVRDARR